MQVPRGGEEEDGWNDQYSIMMAITSAKQVSELHAHGQQVIGYTDIHFWPKVYTEWHCNQPMAFPAMSKETDPELRKLCIRRSMHAYFRGRPVSPMPWHKLGRSTYVQERDLRLAEEGSSRHKRFHLTPPPHVKGHNCRKQATSWADMGGVDPKRICEAADKGISSMFGRHYALDLLSLSRSEVDRRFLQLSASSASERALEHQLGSTTLPGTEQNHTAQQPSKYTPKH